MTNKYNEMQIITPPGRLSFPNVFQATPHKLKRNKDGNPVIQFSTILIIPKKSNISSIINCINQIATAEFKGKQYRNPLRDGDKERSGYDGYQNSWFISAASQFKPVILDQNNTEVLFENQINIYSGCWASLLISPWYYNETMGCGISFNLLGVKKLRDDEQLKSGGISVDTVQSALAGITMTPTSQEQW